MADEISNTIEDGDEPLSELEINKCVAELADRILALTEDPGEHEQIVNELGDVLEGWDKSFPLVTHSLPLTKMVEAIYADQKNHVKEKKNGGE